MGPELELRVVSDWDEVGRVNQAVGEFLAGCGLPTEGVDKYTMVVCELVENGIKYGHFSGDERHRERARVDCRRARSPCSSPTPSATTPRRT